MIVTKLVDFDSYRIITDLGVKMAGQLILFFAAGFIISSAGEVGLLFVVCCSTYVTDFWYCMHAHIDHLYSTSITLLFTMGFGFEVKTAFNML